LVSQAPQEPSSPARTAAATAIAQAADPSECVAALRTFASRRQIEVRPPSGFTSEILKKVDDERGELARTCIDRFLISSNPKVLPGMAELYMEAAQPDKAREAIDAALGAMLPSPQRAAALVAAVSVGLREPKSDERNARLEKLADELDANPAATLDQKWSVHGRLASYYRGDDIDAGILKHGRWMADSAKSFTPEQRKQFGNRLVSSQVSVAEALAGQGMNDDALALLRKTGEEWKDLPRVDESYIRPALERYSLVGTPAAPIKAAQWLNAPPDTKELPMTGAVTLLEFTAHWCGPCRESYPGVNRLRQQFGAKGFRVVMATRYWGYFSTPGKVERDISREEEYKRDLAYFAEYHLDVPVAIGDLVSVKVVDGKVTYLPGPDPNDTAYKVSGIPQIHLIDKKGRIRLIMIGYDDANEPKLAEIIGRLVSER
jgi:thiol-disulfide isomerase/thioredoxin